MPDTNVSLTVNGKDRRAQVPDRTTLADMLRDHLNLTGTHLGCEQGACGACTILLDDLPVRACLTLAVACQGREVTTVEGLAGPDAERLRAAFSEHGALQCGFCTPGMLVSSYALVRRREPLSWEQASVEMSGNVCRCTGYNGIIRAVCSAIDEGTDHDAV